MQARISKGRSALMLVGGLALTAVNVALSRFAVEFYESLPPSLRGLLWILGVILVIAGLSALDRRVKLYIGPDGIRYADWGPKIFPWDAFERFEVVYREKDRFIVPYFKEPDQVDGAGSSSFSIESLFRPEENLPPLCIRPAPLDVGEYDIISTLESHGATVTEAPRVG